MQHPGSPADACPKGHGSTPAHSTAGCEPCRSSPGSSSPRQHRPSCQEAVSLPARPAPGLLSQKVPSRCPSTTTCNRQPALGCTRPSPSFPTPKHRLLNLQPLRLHGAQKTHQPEPKRHSPHHSVLPAGKWHRGLPSLQGCRVSTTGFPIPRNAKGQGKEERNDPVLKIRSASRDPSRTDCGSDDLRVPQRVRRASE